jgi:hypothetical protein
MNHIAHKIKNDLYDTYFFVYLQPLILLDYGNNKSCCNYR